MAFDLRGLSPETANELSALLPSEWVKGERVFQVTPTVHFCMGGVVVDNNRKTSCEGLYAAGEVTAGAYGANRLIGNALAEALVIGGRVGKTAGEATIAQGPSEEFDAAADEKLSRFNALFNNQGQKPGDLIESLKKHVAQCRDYQKSELLEQGDFIPNQCPRKPPPHKKLRLIEENLGQADFTVKEEALIAFARKANLEPLRIPDNEFEVLRNSGTTDAEIIEALGVMELFTAFNKFLDSLEVAIDF
ncbi:FAD-binding protein [Syntrophotalea acetylenivorans]|uniref:FAD-binding protein n=1 Tax=Syntrophotalea acetylenivorans TaxID=1842532 RepID=UPI000AC36C93|nr:FAD-binding protein [Syntrophotalea acetylenivorans]